MDPTSPTEGESVTLIDRMGYVSTLARATPAHLDGTSIGTNIQKNVTST